MPSTSAAPTTNEVGTAPAAATTTTAPAPAATTTTAPAPAATTTTAPAPAATTTAPAPAATTTAPASSNSDLESLKARWNSIRQEPDAAKKLKEYKLIFQEYQAIFDPELKDKILKDTNELVRENEQMTSDTRMNYDENILNLEQRDSICLEAYPDKLMFNPRDSFVKTTGGKQEFKSSGLDRSAFDLLMDNIKLFRIVKSIQYGINPDVFLKLLLTDIELSEIEHFNTMGELTKELREKMLKNLMRFAIKVTHDGTVNDFGLRHLKDNDKTKIQIGLKKATETGKRSTVCDIKYIEKWLQYVKDTMELSKEYVPEEKEFIDTLDNMQTEMLKSRIYVKYSRWDKKLVMDYESELYEIFDEKPAKVKAERKSRKAAQKNYYQQMLSGMPEDLRKQVEDHMAQNSVPF